jgi:hypothetical protein
MSIFDQIAMKIIREQELVIGPLAWTEAGKVAGVHITNRSSGEVEVKNGDPKEVINRLVGQYEHLFGRASHEVCKEAAAPILSTLKPEDLPSSLVA